MAVRLGLSLPVKEDDLEDTQQNPPRARMSESIDTLEAIGAGEHADAEDVNRVAGHIATALRLSLAAMEESLGECRQAVPYSPLHPVLRTDGHFCWCCNHDPEHCSEPQRRSAIGWCLSRLFKGCGLLSARPGSLSLVAR
jgi:hypothetical protein